MERCYRERKKARTEMGSAMNFGLVKQKDRDAEEADSERRRCAEAMNYNRAGKNDELQRTRSSKRHSVER